MLPETRVRTDHDRWDSAYHGYRNFEIEGAGGRRNGPLDAPPLLGFGSERCDLAERPAVREPEDVVIHLEDMDSCMEQQEAANCTFSIGWLLFVCGFVCIFPWAVGGLMPCCSKNRNDKNAAYFNAVAFVVTSIVFLIVYVTYT